MIVSLRRRIWRVEEIAGDVLIATPIDDFSAKPQKFLMELERPLPGAVAEPELDSLGDPTLQSLFLSAIRLDALHGTAPFVSIQRTAVIPVEYQLVPLVMALRQQPSRLLIADTTGLGKTVEAGLIIAELLARGRARSVLIITPANLREQWQEQMRDLFYLDFHVLSSQTRKRLERSIPPGADPWTYFDRLIVSIDYAKDSRIRPEILKRKWDIVVVDEAHNAAMPHSTTGRKADMERWDAIHKIAEVASEHLLLLTATPHNGYTDSYCSLLQMLSGSLVARKGNEAEPYRERAARHVCQRTRNNIQKWFDDAGQKFPFPAREESADTEVPIVLHRDYFRILESLDQVLDDLVKYAETKGKGQPAEWLRLHLHRRALSSPEALRQSLLNRIERLKPSRTREDDLPDGAEGNADETLLASLRDKGAGDVESEEDRDRSADRAVLNVEQRFQLDRFQTLYEELKGIKASKDRKLSTLRDSVLPELFGKAGGDTPARAIVFTRFKDTLFYMERELTKGADFEVITLHGDLSEGERDKRLEQFAGSAKAVLLATDVISEGLNLQSLACMVIHHDLPYNPNRLEQRNGRVDRFGQRAPMVYVRTLFCKDTTDEDVVNLLVRKLDQMRRDLGFAPPIFASDETVLSALTRRRRRRKESGDTLTGDLFAGLVDDELFDTNALKRMQSEGFYGQADVKISDVSERLRQVHARFGSPDQIKDFILFGLRHYNCSVRESKDHTYRIEINNPRLRVAGVPTTLDKVVLDTNERALHGDAVVLDVGHPLVRRLNAVIREDALRRQAQGEGGSNSGGARTAAYAVKGQRGTVLVGHGLLRATAQTEPPTLLEEVVTFGVRFGLGGMTVLTADEVEIALTKDHTPAKVARDEALVQMDRLYRTATWDVAKSAAVERATDALCVHRETLRAELVGAGESNPSWLHGFADIETVGFDLYCLTLLVPEAL